MLGIQAWNKQIQRDSAVVWQYQTEALRSGFDNVRREWLAMVKSRPGYTEDSCAITISLWKKEDLRSEFLLYCTRDWLNEVLPRKTR